MSIEALTQATCDLALRFGEDDEDEDAGPQMVRFVPRRAVCGARCAFEQVCDDRSVCRARARRVDRLVSLCYLAVLTIVALICKSISLYFWFDRKRNNVVASLDFTPILLERK